MKDCHFEWQISTQDRLKQCDCTSFEKGKNYTELKNVRRNKHEIYIFSTAYSAHNN